MFSRLSVAIGAGAEDAQPSRAAFALARGQLLLRFDEEPRQVVLMMRNRMTTRSDGGTYLDLRISMLAEQELTAVPSDAVCV